MNAKIVKERRKFPVKAGHPNINGYRMFEVGCRLVEFTYEIYPDGDKQLISQRKIKTVITYKG
jgi:hypothetical protein